MKKRLLFLPLLAGLALTGCGKNDDAGSNNNPGGEEEDTPTVVPAVTSVEIKDSKSSLSLNSTMQLSATVTVTGNASKQVTWSSNDTTVATVSTSGLVTPKKVGSVTITATSRFDSEKSDSVTIQVVDHGFAPEYYDELDYDLSQEWSEVEGVIKGFLGAGEYSIIAPESVEGGIYSMIYEADPSEGTAGCVEVIIDGMQADSYAGILSKAGWTKVYESSVTTYEAVDPTLTYTVSIDTEFDDYYEPIAPTILRFFKCSDVWEPSVKTQDTAWSKDHYGEYASDEYYEETVDEWLSYVPFVALGSNYEIEYQDNSLYRLFGYDIPDYVSICDYTLDESFLEGYDAVLTGSGLTYDSEGEYYYVNVENHSYVVYFEWGEGGNSIFVQQELAIFDSWPTDYVDEYCHTELESIYTLPEVSGLEEYTFDIVEDYDEDYNPIYYAEVYAGEITKTAADAYFAGLQSSGFKVISSPATDEDFASWMVTKGKLVIESYFVENYDYETEEFDPNNGQLVFYIDCDPTVREIPGLYELMDSSNLLVGKTLELSNWLEVFELGTPEFTFTSSDPTKVTVDEETGLITAVALTEEEMPVTVTVSTTVDDTPYEASIEINVIEATEVTDTVVFSSSNVGSARTEHGATITIGTGKGQNPAIFNSSDNAARVYWGNTITVAAPEGSSISSIAINFSSKDTGTPDISANVGSYSNGTWTGDAESVVFSVGGTKGHRKIVSISVTFVDVGETGGGGGSSETADLESIASEIAEMTIGDADSYFKISDTEYYVGVYWEEEGSMSLEDAVDEASYYTPEEFIYGTEIQTGTDQSGEEYAAMTLTNEEQSVFIDIESYVEDGYVCVDFYIYVE